MNALLLGSLLYQSRLVPRVLPVLGFIGAALLVTSTMATLFGANEYGSAMSGLFAIPIAVWEFSLGVYLVVKGFRADGLRQARLRVRVGDARGGVTRRGSPERAAARGLTRCAPRATRTRASSPA